MPLDYILTSRDLIPEQPLIMTEAVVKKRYRRRFKDTAELIRALQRRQRASMA
jgi:hypothetical protein